MIAYQAKILRNVSAFCRLWIEDVHHNRIAGGKKYKSCDGDDYKHINFNDQTYYIVAKVLGSTEHQKIRGPFNANYSCSIIGDVDTWHLDC
jgi:hypothetical protein